MQPVYHDHQHEYKIYHHHHHCRKGSKQMSPGALTSHQRGWLVIKLTNTDFDPVSGNATPPHLTIKRWDSCSSPRVLPESIGVHCNKSSAMNPAPKVWKKRIVKGKMLAISSSCVSLQFLGVLCLYFKRQLVPFFLSFKTLRTLTTSVPLS